MTGKRLKTAAAVLCLLLLFSVLTPAALADDPPAADIVFLLDTTASMENEMPLVRQQTGVFLNTLTAAGMDVRVAIVQFKDITKDGDSSTLIARSNGQPWLDPEEALVVLDMITPAGGGSDEPAGTEADYPPDCETPLDAVGCMLQTLSFRPQAGKHAVLITDGGCKPDNNYGFAAVGEESAQTAASKKLAEAGVSMSVVTYGSSIYRDPVYGYEKLRFSSPGETGFFDQADEYPFGPKLANMVTDYLSNLIIRLSGESTIAGDYLLKALLSSKEESLTVKGLRIDLLMPEGFQLTDGSLSITEPELTLTNTESKAYFWEVKLPVLPENTNYTCAVTARATTFAGVTWYAQLSLTVPGSDVHDYSWDFDRDSYSFANIPRDEYGYGFGFGPYYLSDGDHRMLKENLAKTELDYIGRNYGKGAISDPEDGVKNFLNNELKDWVGSCFALSLTMGLFKVGALDPSEFSAADPATTRSIPPLKENENSALESMINVYHVTQFSAFETARVKEDGFDKVIQDMFDRGKAVGSSGHMPYLVKLAHEEDNGRWTAHAVLCYGAEDGEWIYKDATWHKRLLIADPNRIYGAEYIYISDDWQFAVYSAKDLYDVFGYRRPELTLITTIHYFDLVANDEARLMSKYGVPFTVTSENGSLTVTEGGASGDLDFVPDFAANARADGGDESVWPDHILQDGASSYTVTPAGDGNELDFKLFFSDVALGLTGAAESAEVSRDGSIEVTGASGQVTVSVTANESELGFVTVSGEAEGDFSLELDEDGSLTVSGGLADYTVSNMTAEPETDEAVIHGGADAKISAPTEEEPDIVVLLDADGDGAFESELDKEHPGHVYEYTDNGDGTHTAACYMGDDTFTERHHFSGLVCRDCGAFILPAGSGSPHQGGHHSSGGDEEAWVNPFRDVDESDWFYDAVRYANENGLMQGVSATVFAPDLAFSRAMLVTVLYRLEGEPKVSAAAPFNDVAAGQWYSDAVAWAAAKGIVKGCGDGSFCPEDSVTREQFAAILWRYAGLKGYDRSPAADLSGYADASAVGDWAREAMSWACATGLIKGRTASELAPQGGTSRAEAAAMLTRFCEKYL